MTDFWSRLGKAVPKKGYAKKGKAIDKKISAASRSAARKRKANVAQPKKEKPQKKQAAPVRKVKGTATWKYRDIKQTREGFQKAVAQYQAQGLETRVDGTGSGYVIYTRSK